MDCRFQRQQSRYDRLISTANWALLISIVSAAVTATGLFWQFVLYRLSGPRLAVRLRPALLEDTGTLYHGPERGWGNVDPPEFRIGPWVIDLVRIQVVNVGRAPVAVSEIGIDISRTRRSGRKRSTLRGFPVLVAQGTKEEVVKLDPGDTLWTYFDLWTLTEHARERIPGRSITMRATAAPAGRRIRRSPWRTRWSIPPTGEVFRQHIERPPEAERRAFHALWHWLRSVDQEHEAFLSPWWRAIHPMLVEGKSLEDIDELLKNTWGGIADTSMIAYQVHDAYTKALQSRDAIA